MGYPRTSALVSGYYAEDWIETRLINLKEQECEIILVCQAGSAEHEIGAQYGLSPILTPDIPTIYAAWNLGIMAAHGQYLTSANCDDMFYDHALTIMADELERTGAAICHSQLDRLKDGKREMWKKVVTGSYKELRRRCFVGPMPVWRKELHDRYGYFDEKYHVAGDWDFWLRCVKAGERVCFVDQVLGMYRWRADSLERRDEALHSMERAKIRKNYG